jgi:hypothetical protein
VGFAPASAERSSTALPSVPGRRRGGGLVRLRASSPPVHLRSTRRAASAPRPGRGFRRGSEACTVTCTVFVRCESGVCRNRKRGVCACYYDPHAKTCTVCSDRRRLMAFISLNARFAEHRTRLVCLGVSPSPRVRCLLACFTYLLTYRHGEPYRDPARHVSNRSPTDALPRVTTSVDLVIIITSSRPRTLYPPLQSSTPDICRKQRPV